MNKIFSRIGLSAIAMVAFCFLPFGAKALTISPPLIDHRLNPGDTVLETVKIYNEGEHPITVYPLLRNFTAGDGENGEPQFVPPEVDDNGTGLAQWITMDGQPLTIGPKQRTNLLLNMNVPRDAQPGGHYGAVVLSTDPPNNQRGVGVSQQMATLIMVRISGDVREVGSIAEFGFAKPKVWHNHLPIDMFFRFENSGNTHLRPTGNIFITNMWGRQVASVQANPDFGGVLPRSIRKFGLSWEKEGFDENDSGLKREWKNFGFGRYKAVLVLYYGNDNKMTAAETEFTVWPWRLMLLAAALLAFLSVLTAILSRMYRRKLIDRLERAMAKRKGLKTEMQIREEVEADLRRKLEGELRGKIEREDAPDGEKKQKTDLPNELKG
ncbi:hypothetical protein JW899_00435 [Candidatus Uhrbacteria bacterium]|nr:hypothetical protein [Candidatus Uhrbacteria bacterium]